MFFIRFVVHFGDRLPLPSAIMHIRFSDLKTADWRTARRTATICQFSCCDLMMIVSSHHRRRKKRQNKTGNTKRSRVELHRRWTTHIRRINERSQRLITNCIYKSWLSRAIIHILKASAVDAFWTQFYMFIVYCVWSPMLRCRTHISHHIWVELWVNQSRCRRCRTESSSAISMDAMITRFGCLADFSPPSSGLLLGSFLCH